jgi:hypothetical protein
MGFGGEESNLSLIVRLEIKKAVAAQAAPGHAFNLGHFQHGMRARRMVAVTEKIMSGGNVNVPNLHMAKMAFSRPMG